MGRTSKSNLKYIDVEEIGKKKEKSNNKSVDERIKVIVKCGGMSIGNNLGIGNGNMNGGGGGGCCGCSTGGTGSTGGNLICDARCNAVCEQVFLEQFADPQVVSRIGQEIIWTLRATNISGTGIIGPLVVSSSFFGTRLLSLIGLEAGETLSINVSTILNEADINSSIISSVAFVARGIPTGIPGNYNPGERISSVVTTTVVVNLPDLDIQGTVDTPNPGQVNFSLEITNKGSIPITNFILFFNNVFGNCLLPPHITSNPQNAFQLLTNPGTGATGGLNIRFIAGITLDPAETFTAVVSSAGCFNCCQNCNSDSLCIFDYTFGGRNTAILARSVGLPKRGTGF